MLHIVNKSPFERNALQSCLSHAQPGAAVLLIEDGVYGATRGNVAEARIVEAMKTVAVYALAPDVEARAMQGRVIAGIRLVDYGGFVDLAAEHSNAQSWL